MPGKPRGDEDHHYIFGLPTKNPEEPKFFTAAFDGVLVTDFRAACNTVACTLRQACLPHLFRALDKTDEGDRGAPAFSCP